jgi:hypothetical protein
VNALLLLTVEQATHRREGKLPGQHHWATGDRLSRLQLAQRVVEAANNDDLRSVRAARGNGGKYRFRVGGETAQASTSRLGAE